MIATGNPKITHELEASGLTTHDPTSTVHALIVAGGQSRRMGRPKACVRYGGEPQVRRLYAELRRVAGAVYVGVPAHMGSETCLRGLPLLFDRDGVPGPMASVLAAFHLGHRPWLVVAVDMPAFDESAARYLLARRRPAAATAYRATDGGPEPLCCVYEPSIHPRLLQAAAGGRYSLRDVLVQGGAETVLPTPPGVTLSIDTPAQSTRIAAALCPAPHGSS